MKQTRKIFVLDGEKSRVRNVLPVLNHYEAVVVSNGKEWDIKRIFACNKNAAVMGVTLSEEWLKNGSISIYIGNSLGRSDVIVEETDERIRKQFEQIAAKYNIDIGDYIPDGEIKQPIKENCILCNIYKERHNPKNPMNMVIYESPNFYVCPAKGAMVEGYVMICPKEHILSCAALSKEQRDELVDVINDVTYILKKIYGNEILMFEHGSGLAGKCKHEKSIVHAHLHVVPTNIRITERQRELISMQKVTYDEIYKFAQVPYFWCINDSSMSEMFITADPEVYIPRQYARQIMAQNLGIGGELWNWREYSFDSKINDTLMEIAEYLKKNYLRLPEQIRTRTSAFLEEMSRKK